MVSENASTRYSWFLALIVALVLALFLAGCGGQQASSASSSESGASAESSAAADEIAIPEDLASATETAKGIADNGAAEDVEDLSALPTRESDKSNDLEVAELAEGSADQSKVPQNQILLQEGGVQMCIPSAWLVSRDYDGYVMGPRDGSVTGYLYSDYKKSGVRYDLESMAASIPKNMASNGWTNIEIIDYGTAYSDKGTLCSAYIFYAASRGGSEYVLFQQFVESASYINVLELGGPSAGFEANYNDLKAAANSLGFVPGEAI